MEYSVFEQRLLHLIFRSNCPLVPVHVAYYLGVPIADARAHLDTMVTNSVLEVDSDDAGHILYVYPQRPPVDKLPPPKRLRRKQKIPQVTALQPVQLAPGEFTLVSAPAYSPGTAAALSVFMPGVGQIYSGRVAQGIGWLLATFMGYLFLIPGIILHVCCVVNAASVPTPLPSLLEQHPALGDGSA